MHYNEMIAQKALSLTAINLADAVLNPYRGCFYACRHCYAAHMKFALKRGAPWGSFVDIKSNMPDLLEKELVDKRFEAIQSVLIGSTTEVYQPIEKKAQLMPRMLKVLKDFKKKIVILTRSPLILRDIDLLAQMDATIYFTITPDELFDVLEPHGPAMEKRWQAISELAGRNIAVYPYVCPLFPDSFDLEELFCKAFEHNVPELFFENVNLKVLSDLQEKESFELDAYGQIYRRTAEIYHDQPAYENYWGKIRHSMEKLSAERHLPFTFYLHDFEAFCHIDYQ